MVFLMEMKQAALKKKQPRKSDSISPDHPVEKQSSRLSATFAAISQRPAVMLFVLMSLQPRYQQTGAS